jgi:magnesium chelatase subunit I
VLVGSGNPEEGELRPQLLDRFGLSVEVRSPRDVETRVEVIRAATPMTAMTAAFMAEWRAKDAPCAKILAGPRRSWRRWPDPDTVLL